MPLWFGFPDRKSNSHGGFFRGPGHLKREIRTVEPGGDPQRVLKLQQILDILPDLLGSGSGKGPHHWPLGKVPDQLRNLQVTGPEILTPLGHAVGLVHRHHRNGQLFRQMQEALRLEPFRSHIKKPALTPPHLPEHIPV